MSRRSIHFELYTIQGDRQVLESTHDTQEEAVKRAKDLALRMAKELDALKVIKETTNQSGATMASEVFFHKVPKPKAEADISSLDEVAPVCESYEDMMKVEARVVFRRLLRPYLEKIDATPLETVHLYGLLRRVMDVGTVFQAATGRAGMLQSKLNGESARKNMARLFDLADSMRKRAEAADRLKAHFPAELTVENFDGIHRLVDQRVAEGERPYLRRVQMARLLATTRGEGAKLDLAIDLLQRTRETRTYHLCDHAIADLCLSTHVIQDMFGPHPCLGAFLAELCLLLTGRLPTDDRDETDPLRVLGKRFKDGELAQVRKVFTERLLRELNGTNPLDRKEPEKERIWINLVTKAGLQKDGALVGGAEMVRALYRRRAHALARAQENDWQAIDPSKETSNPKAQLEELLAG